MPITVLIAYDGSEPAMRALSFADTHFDAATFVIATVVDPYERLYGAYGSVDLDTPASSDPTVPAEERLEETRQQFDADVEVRTVVAVGRPSNTLLTLAHEHEVDHIVIGSLGREGVDRLLLGSVAETVLRRATVPVTVVP